MNEDAGAGAGPVTVLTVRDPGVLAVAQSLLEDAGIPCVLKGENVQSLTPLYTWVELQVAADDAETARTLLADLTRP